MRIALLADIHANLPALEAALRDIRRKHAPDRIISLGDQVNLGPCPRETLALLRAHDVFCLRGNHERYILSAMRGDPAYDGANFASLRFNAARLAESDIAFDTELRIGHIRFVHAMPGDDRFPVYEIERAIPLLQKMDTGEPAHIVCGHGHNPTHIRIGNLTLDSIGSTGCMDDGIPGAAPYAILEMGPGWAGIRPYYAAYDTRALRPLFGSSGMAQACPVMAHIACLQMEQNRDFLVPFVKAASARAKAAGLSSITPQIWREADAAFPWPDGKGTAEFWRE